jgi:hypothetical protein
MDDCIADFCRHPAFAGQVVTDANCAVMYKKGFFLSLEPVEGALVAVRQLIRMGYDVQIATQPVAESAYSYREKVQWLGLWFPELIKKVNMVQDKGLLKADYLVDDRPDKWQKGFEANGGKFVNFEYVAPWIPGVGPGANVISWNKIIMFFLKELINEQN